MKESFFAEKRVMFEWRYDKPDKRIFLGGLLRRSIPIILYLCVLEPLHEIFHFPLSTFYRSL